MDRWRSSLLRVLSASPLPSLLSPSSPSPSTTQLIVHPSVFTEVFARSRRVWFMENKKKKYLPARIKARVASAFYCVSDVVRSVFIMPYNLWPQTTSVFKPRNNSLPDPHTVVYVQSNYTEFVHKVREELNILLKRLRRVNIARAPTHSLERTVSLIKKKSSLLRRRFFISNDIITMWNTAYDLAGTVHWGRKTIYGLITTILKLNII